MKEYQQKNKTSLAVKKKARYEANKEKVISRNRLYRATNREKYNIAAHKYRKRNREKILGYSRARLTTWEGFIPKITQCQMCGRDIYFNDFGKNESMFFDHRNGGKELIQGSPTVWLQRHRRTPETEKIWELCDFGMLCRRCNIVLPTKDRQLYLVNVTKYINRS